jgi:hypothetical protein
VASKFKEEAKRFYNDRTKSLYDRLRAFEEHGKSADYIPWAGLKNISDEFNQYVRDRMDGRRYATFSIIEFLNDYIDDKFAEELKDDDEEELRYDPTTPWGQLYENAITNGYIEFTFDW